MMHNQLDPTRPTQIAWANRLITDGPIHFLGQRLESRVFKHYKYYIILYIYGTDLPFRIETSLRVGSSMDA